MTEPVKTAEEAIEAAAALIENFTQAQHVAEDIKNGVFPRQSPEREAMASAIRAIPVATPNTHRQRGGYTGGV